MRRGKHRDKISIRVRIHGMNSGSIGIRGMRQNPGVWNLCRMSAKQNPMSQVAIDMQGCAYNRILRFSAQSASSLAISQPYPQCNNAKDACNKIQLFPSQSAFVTMRTGFFFSIT